MIQDRLSGSCISPVEDWIWENPWRFVSRKSRLAVYVEQLREPIFMIHFNSQARLSTFVLRAMQQSVTIRLRRPDKRLRVSLEQTV